MPEVLPDMAVSPYQGVTFTEAKAQIASEREQIKERDDR